MAYSLKKFTCIGCGKLIEIRRDKNKTKYCSVECFRKNRNTENMKTGEYIKCDNCGKFVYKPKNEIKRYKKHYCSVKCRKTIMTDEIKKKISLGNKGKKRTKEYCINASLIRKGQKSWNKGLKNIHSEEGKIRIGNIWRGKHLPEYVKEKMSLSHKEEKAYQWKGGISIINYGLRKSFPYRKWRKSVFERDNYTCQICGKRGNKLNAHHISEWANYEDLRFDINNGITLCKECHIGLVNKKENQWKSFFDFVVNNQLYNSSILII